MTEAEQKLRNEIREWEGNEYMTDLLTDAADTLHGIEEALETILTSHWEDPAVALREIQHIVRTTLREDDEPDATLTAAGWGFY